MQIQTYKHKQNARRAARLAGLDPDTAVVVIGDGTFSVNHPSGNDGLDIPEAVMVSTEERRQGWIDNPPATSPKHKDQIIMPKPRSARARKKDRIAPTGNKTALLISMLKDKRGATVDQLTKALDWLPHTLRARISRLPKDDPKIKIARERKDGVTSYRIAS